MVRRDGGWLLSQWALLWRVMTVEDDDEFMLCAINEREEGVGCAKWVIIQKKFPSSTFVCLLPYLISSVRHD